MTIGQSLRVSIIVDERKGVLQVPADAILDMGEGPILTYVRDGKTVVLHPQPKTPHGGSIEVAGTDLKEGEPVIVDGGYNLPEGTLVKPAGEKETEDAKEEEPAKGASQGGGEGGGREMSVTMEPETNHHAPEGRGINLVARAKPYFGLIVLTTSLLTAFGIVAMLAHAQRHLSRSRVPADRRHRPDARPGCQGRRGGGSPGRSRRWSVSCWASCACVEIGPRRGPSSPSISPPAPTWFSA